MLTHICVINLFHQAAVLQVTECDYPWLVGAVFSPHQKGRWRVRLRKVLKPQQWQDKIDVAEVERLSANTPELQEDAARLEANLKKAKRQAYTSLSHLLSWYGNGAPTMPGDMACHYKCDKHLCLNPHHISWGDHTDNAGHKKWHHANKTGQHGKGATCPKNAD